MGDPHEHEPGLVEWLSSMGIRSPDWSFDPGWLEPTDRLEYGIKIPIRSPGEKVVSGVYLFYDWTPSWNPKELDAGRFVSQARQIVPLYVGKAANLWNRMQAHWSRPEGDGWIFTYFQDVEKDLLAGFLMACAWKEDERAGVEARLIRTLRPKYCRRTE